MTDPEEVTEAPPFSVISWYSSIPLCEDLWLGMQAQNIAIVDMTFIRGFEREVVEEYWETDRTPMALRALVALSEMWMFALYEFLRTWRQRARELLDLADKCAVLQTDAERKTFVEEAVAKVKLREKLIRVAPFFHAEHVSKIGDAEFVNAVRTYFMKTEPLFRDAEAMRVTVAKHEVPKTPGLIAEAPGYARMDLMTGSVYWSIDLKDDTITVVNRRRIANEFFGLEDDA